MHLMDCDLATSPASITFATRLGSVQLDATFEHQRQVQVASLIGAWPSATLSVDNPHPVFTGKLEGTIAAAVAVQTPGGTVYYHAKSVPASVTFT